MGRRGEGRGGEGKGGERRGGEQGRREGEVRPPNVRDALTPLVSSLSEKYCNSQFQYFWKYFSATHTSYNLFNCTKDIRHTKIKEEKTGVNTSVAVAVVLQICSVPVVANSNYSEIANV